MTVNSVPSNVKFALSSISPAVPARTTRPVVKSSTLRVAIVALLLTSSIPFTVSVSVVVS